VPVSAAFAQRFVTILVQIVLLSTPCLKKKRRRILFVRTSSNVYQFR